MRVKQNQFNHTSLNEFQVISVRLYKLTRVSCEETRKSKCIQSKFLENLSTILERFLISFSFLISFLFLISFQSATTYLLIISGIFSNFSFKIFLSNFCMEFGIRLNFTYSMNKSHECFGQNYLALHLQ